VLVALRLAGDAEPDTRNRITTRFRNHGTAFLTVREALAARQLIPGPLYSVFDRGVDLFLHRAVFCKPAGHRGFP
jgi:hypothetical protein